MGLFFNDQVELLAREVGPLDRRMESLARVMVASHDGALNLAPTDDLEDVVASFDFWGIWEDKRMFARRFGC